MIFKKCMLALFAVMLFFACEKKLDIDIPDSESKLVVYSILNANELIWVNVSKTVLFSQDISYAPVTDADVLLYENGQLLAKIPHDYNGYYMTDLNPKLGSVYKLVVEHEIYQNVESDIVMPQSVEFSLPSSYLENVAVDYGSSIFLNGIISFVDNKDQENAYMVKLKKCYALTIDVDTEYRCDQFGYSTSNPIIMSQYAESEGDGEFVTDFFVSGDYVFGDQYFNGNTLSYDFSLNYDFWDAGDGVDTVIVVLQSVSVDYYRYFMGYNDNSIGGDFFSEPVPVPSNIKNGLGLFAGITEFEMKIIVSATDYQESFNRRQNLEVHY